MRRHSEHFQQCSIALFQSEIRNNIDALTILLSRWSRKSNGPPENLRRCRFLCWNCEGDTNRGQRRHQHRWSIGGTHHLLNQYVVPPLFGAARCRGAHDKFIRKRCHSVVVAVSMHPRYSVTFAEKGDTGALADDCLYDDIYLTTSNTTHYGGYKACNGTRGFGHLLDTR